jgi:hypothetical protein
MTSCDKCIKLQDEIVDLKHAVTVEQKAQADKNHTLNNYEEEIVRLRGIVSTLWDALDTYGPEYMHGNAKSFYRKQFQSAIRASS